MKKFAVCYQASFQELKHVKTLTTAAMLMAVSVVLGYFTIEAGPYLKIGFGGVVNQFVYYLFGPVAGAVYGGVLDLVKYVVKPTGAFFPGFTLNAMLGGVLLGLIESLAAGYLNTLTGGVIGSGYKDIFAFVVLIVVLIIRPHGLLGRKTAEKV